ncbi:hypothetical protein DYB32_010671 [Aphanomyces invadans]|uniref:Uncharacterized protein n=1 Tax=Aphanomyces invadans TaxID=157072 RepID=A0A3R6WDZ3_9STRA|nr:hypothetical protein DYB32_010671 [Aphanomyces invadans]
MSTPIKIRFIDEEDILLLRDINARLPFMAKRVQVMQGWTGIADAVQSLDDFDRPGFDGKRAQNRFTLLLETHRHKDEASKRASGSGEEYGEKLQLLDKLTSAFDDWKNAEKARLDEVQREADRVDAMAATIREEAMQSLGKRKRTDAHGLVTQHSIAGQRDYHGGQSKKETQLLNTGNIETKFEESVGI